MKAAVLCLFLVACGDDGNNNPIPDAPTFPDGPINTGDNKPPRLTVPLTDQLSLVGRTVVLEALATDTDGDPVTVAWTQTAGPTAALADATAAKTSFIARAVGVYKFDVVANDGTADSPSREAVVTIFDLDGGEDFSLALKPDGTLLAWGDNTFGQLGDPGVATSRAVPGPVCDTDQTDCATHPFTGVVAITTGHGHALALRADGSVWSWGEGFNGQLGNTTFSTSSTPHHVCNLGATDCNADPLIGVQHIAAGFLFSVALKTDGSVVSWGQDFNGQLGDGLTTDRAVPVRVCAPVANIAAFGGGPCSTFLDHVVQLAAGGGGHTLAILDDGSLIGWGHNKSGQVGIGDSSQRNVLIPKKVCAEGATAPCSTFLTGVIAIDAWSGHSLALRSDNSLWGWGSNDESELGAITTTICGGGTLCTETPVPVCASGDSPCTTPFADVATFAAGRRFSVALRNDGSVWSWGNNAEGEQGDGSTNNRNFPHQVCAVGQTAPCQQFLGGVSLVAAGSFHAFALRVDGSLLSWGDNDFGQLGNNDATGTDSAIPVVVSGF